VQGIERRLDEAHELTLFRCAQEALSNVQRHGQATEVCLQVIYQPNGMRLIVQDNGVGFVIPSPSNGFPAQGHYGLVSIRERVRQLNGTVDIQSAPGRGTRLAIYIPSLEQHQPHDTVLDPVCSAPIKPRQAYSSLVYHGQRFYFCCPVCQGSFQSSPELYLQREFSGVGCLAGD
jgi:YHS domain-containing protein